MVFKAYCLLFYIIDLQNNDFGVDFIFIRALKDAESAILLSSTWPKGHFRKGRALTGLKVITLIW